MRPVIIYRGEDGYWVTECPSLPGCISQGATHEEAAGNIKVAIRGSIAALEDDRLPVPEEHFDAILIAMTPLPRVSGKECIRALDRGTLRSIIRQAGMTVEEFVAVLCVLYGSAMSLLSGASSRLRLRLL